MARVWAAIGRARLVLLIAMLAGAISLSALIRFYGFENTFGLWNVPAYNLPFLDLRLITGAAESHAQGYDPAAYDPGDPLGRIFNYPKIWYVVLASGIDGSWTVPLGIAIIALFLVSVYVFPGRLSLLSAFLILLALASPSIMLAFARVNVDMLIFSLMTLSLLLVDRSAVSALGIILLAILLKIIPVLGVGGFIGRDRTRSLRLVLGAILFTGSYFLFTLKDMIFIFNNTQKGFDGAYGLAVLPALLRQVIHDRAVREGPAYFYQAVSALDNMFLQFPQLPYIAASLILIVCAFLGLRYSDRSEAADSRNVRAFWMGAGMYIGTFFIGNNWNYRMIFLILTLPQLGDWVTGMDQTTKTVSIFTLIMLFLSLWYSVVGAVMTATISFGAYLGGLLTVAANWSLCAALIYLFVASLPGWIQPSPGSILGKWLPIRRPSAAEQ